MRIFLNDIFITLICAISTKLIIKEINGNFGCNDSPSANSPVNMLDGYKLRAITAVVGKVIVTSLLHYLSQFFLKKVVTITQRSAPKAL